MVGAVNITLRRGLQRAALWRPLLGVLCAWPLLAWPLGAAAPFTPPRPTAAPNDTAAYSAAAPERTASSAGAPVLLATGLAGIKLGAPPQALIDGQWWAQGALVRGARLVDVSASAVQLRHPDGKLEQLVLTPQVEWLRLQQRSTGERSPAPKSARSTEMRPP